MNDKKHATIHFPADRGKFLDWATSIDDGCVSVGGLAIRIGLMGPGVVEPESPRVLGRLIEYARNQQGLSIEEMVEQAGIDLAALVEIEMHDTAIRQLGTICQLARGLNLQPDKLLEAVGRLEAAGVAAPTPEVFSAALKFAARSEPTAESSQGEREALEEFVKVLAEL